MHNNSGNLNCNLNTGKTNNIGNNSIYLQFNKNNNNLKKGLKYCWIKLNENNNRLQKSKNKKINKKVNNIIDKLYRNLVDFNFQGNNDFLISTKPTRINCAKYYSYNNDRQINNFNSSVTIKNPFKI